MPDSPKQPALLSPSSLPTKRIHVNAGTFGHSHSMPRTSATNQLEDANTTLSRPPGHADTFASQLPTPQTHSSANVLPYFPGVVRSPGSPLAYVHPRAPGGGPTSSFTTRIQSQPESLFQDPEILGARLPQARTPGVSPLHPAASVMRRPLSAPLLSSVPQEQRVTVKAESPPPLLAPAHRISHSETTFLNLGSPTLSTAQPDPTSPANTQAVELLTPRPISHLVNAVELFSPAHIVERHPSPARPSDRTSSLVGDCVTLSAEGVDGRHTGGQLDRPRDYNLSMDSPGKGDIENRHSELLARTYVNAAERVMGEESGEGSKPGILTSPAKGRRLQLFDFQETSEESFEESLMTYGYGTYGEPRTPQRPITAADGRSQEAMKWLAHNTPTAPSITCGPQLDLEASPSEKELKKRKRLEAFQGSAARAYAKLYPAELEGMGRVLLNIPPEDAVDILGSPAKKRIVGRKKRGGATASKRGRAPAESTRGNADGTEPHWLDKEYPWCLREREREEELQARNADRLKWIERYFSQDTDSDDELIAEKSEEKAPPSSSSLLGQAYGEPPVILRKGRGKAVPLQINPDRPRSFRKGSVAPPSDTQNNGTMYFPSDPADARTALLSKRSVRLLAQRRLRQNGMRFSGHRGAGEERLACACGRDDDDGRPAVQCDDCHNWHHLDCIGVQDESELGEEDDPWFCSACLPESRETQRQPIFAPTEERPVQTSARSDVAFYSSSSPLSGTLQTPIQGQSRLHSGQFFRRSIWDDTHTGPGPSTPVTMSRGVRVFTPGSGYDEYELDRIGAFDSFASPSRPGFSSGQKSDMLYSTPKNTNASQEPGDSRFGSAWLSRVGGLFTTPTPRQGPGGAGYGGYDQEDSGGAPFSIHYGQYAKANAMYAVDDTPIRRVSTSDAKTKQSSLHSSSAAFLAESPLPGRAGRLSMLEDSPLAHITYGRNKANERGGS